MSKPIFQEAFFTFLHESEIYEVIMLPTDEKNTFKIQILSNGNYLHAEKVNQNALVNRTNALFHLCKFLKLDTNNIH